ncbi:TonB-dependent receptor domain-containing protein [Flavobacterium silvaticum]|uniref:TonB-dependent receptor n=1 Tax=Flavobacterium silvaticum TaxID=1852020 RepID=A0A972JG44_9FLAO|nr:outer membrane beta-barrel family protein [Flavobacterium silvaticum]NMH28664.1 TonB-dependent receptor [Flavobacterium silvaticum]
MFRKCFLLLMLIGLTAAFAQNKTATVSGQVREKATNIALAYANVALKHTDGKIVSGTITNEQGRFSFEHVASGNYLVEYSMMGLKTNTVAVFVGNLNDFIELPVVNLEADSQLLQEVTVTANKTEEVSAKMDKKTFNLSDNVSQTGGSLLQAMQNMPGVSTQDGKVLLRGNDHVMILVDGKQTALTGIANQSGLDNIPASAIEKIEIINNPSAKYDANGNAGIINIIYKKNKQEGLNGKVGIGSGYGSLWERKSNLPTINPQYSLTPKINPSLSLNYRKEKINVYFQSDYLYTETLNKNEFVNRFYDDGTIIHQQTKRNRDTHFTTLKTGVDWNYDDHNTVAFSGMFGSEKIVDHGEEPFFNSDFSQRLRLWQFVENELKTTVMASASWNHKFTEPGHFFNTGINYTFHREDERYAFKNILPDFSGTDAFKLLSDEKVIDVNFDYTKPLKYGRIEGGVKFRNREIPTNMQFYPGQNSPIDSTAGGRATYREMIPALYGNYVFENAKFEAEAGLRMEYAHLRYDVDPNHPTYKSDGYDYIKPFPNLRLAYKLAEKDKVSLFYNRRVDRPAEIDIRIFPKYDDAEIIKVGNPALQPQFTDNVELGYKRTFSKGYLFASAYHKYVRGTISRIASSMDGSNLIYNVFQNAGKSYATGIEFSGSLQIAPWFTSNLNLNGYKNRFDAFTVTVLYPQPNTIYTPASGIYSGSVKSNNTFKLGKTAVLQVSAAWLAPDIIPQGKTNERFSVDAGIKKTIQKGKGEIFLNATDLFNTLVIKKEVYADGFRYQSSDYYETQVVRFGYSYKF